MPFFQKQQKIFHFTLFIWFEIILQNKQKLLKYYFIFDQFDSIEKITIWRNHRIVIGKTSFTEMEARRHLEPWYFTWVHVHNCKVYPLDHDSFPRSKNLKSLYLLPESFSPSHHLSTWQTRFLLDPNICKTSNWSLNTFNMSTLLDSVFSDSFFFFLKNSFCW